MCIFALCQCTDYASRNVGVVRYAGAGEAYVAHVMFAVDLGEAVWCLYYPSHDGPAVMSSPTSISM